MSQVRITEDLMFERLKNGQYGYAANQTFQAVIRALKEGAICWRTGWNRERQFIFLMPGGPVAANRQPLTRIFGPGEVLQQSAHYMMHTSEGTLMPWVPCMGELLLDDWNISFSKPKVLFPDHSDSVPDYSDDAPTDEGGEPLS